MVKNSSNNDDDEEYIVDQVPGADNAAEDHVQLNVLQVQDQPPPPPSAVVESELLTGPRVAEFICSVAANISETQAGLHRLEMREMRVCSQAASTRSCDGSRGPGPRQSTGSPPLTMTTTLLT